LDLEKEHQVHAAQKSRKTKKNVPWDRSSQWGCNAAGKPATIAN
jgi:hypothetical protein